MFHHGVSMVFALTPSPDPCTSVSTVSPPPWFTSHISLGPCRKQQPLCIVTSHLSRHPRPGLAPTLHRKPVSEDFNGIKGRGEEIQALHLLTQQSYHNFSTTKSLLASYSPWVHWRHGSGVTWGMEQVNLCLRQISGVACHKWQVVKNVMWEWVSVLVSARVCPAAGYRV